ncbi:MAG TPA: aldehyde dehydrogenase family protein [Candidatus Dormibacteraeota bacterium]|nr:aldehyde dehydrogenase family protein [Candidatus Dormibacteraeota bacterium]
MAIATQRESVSSLVAGTAVAGRGQTLVSRNPSNLADEVAEVQLVDVEQFLDACRDAKGAQQEWAAVPAPVRARAIEQLGRLVEANKVALAHLVTREIGKPYKEALGEVQEVLDTCSFFVGEGRRLYGQTVPSEMRDKQLFTFRTPVGTALIITAGNFPVAVPSWYIVPALLCGNTVVWKPAEYTPAIAAAFTQLMVHSGIPAGVLQVVFADGATTFAGVEAALAAGLVDKVGFTGSTPVGQALGALTGRYLQSPCLELGGKNPLVVMPDADIDLAVEGCLFSGFGTAGQRCTSLGTAWIHDDIHDEFIARFQRAVETAAIGDPTSDVLYGPMINQRFYETFLGWLELVRSHHRVFGSTGTGRITASNPRRGFVGDPDAGLFCHPMVVDGIRPGDELYGTETFGPIVGTGRFANLEEAIDLANGHGYGLSASIYTTDPKSAFKFREGSRAGMISVNNSTSGAEAHLPFGGNGKSGNGSRQSGVWVLDQFTRWQAMNWDYSGKLQKAQMDTVALEGDLDFRL